jgi:membrane protein implicated in regulation of membrane protease activity
MPSTDPEHRPSAFVWLIALLSLVLPIIGVGLALYGAFKGFSGHAIGWLWLAIGIAVLIADLVIDERWSYGMKSAEPDLNRRGDQLVGEIVTVVEPIEAGGRGSVQFSDTLWSAEGAAAAAGAKVRVSGCKGTVLTVEAV